MITAVPLVTGSNALVHAARAVFEDGRQSHGSARRDRTLGCHKTGIVGLGVEPEHPTSIAIMPRIAMPAVDLRLFFR